MLEVVSIVASRVEGNTPSTKIDRNAPAIEPNSGKDCGNQEGRANNIDHIHQSALYKQSRGDKIKSKSHICTSVFNRAGVL